MKEIFKVIPSFPDYLVSNLGRVKTLKRKIRYTHAVTKKEHFRETSERFLKVQYNNLTGYKFHQLYLNKKMYNRPIHQLVADAFLLKDDSLDVVNHIDGNKHNNCLDNLEWCTNSYNHEHATNSGLKAKGASIGTSKLNDNCLHAIKYFLNKGYSQSELAIAFNISRPNINLIANNKTWKHIALTGEELQVNL
jgi:hypothetical protein